MAGSDTTLATPAPVSTPPGKPTGAAFRPDIEGLRAVAVGLVLLYHAGLRPVTGGYVGVDVFFVISGFLITGLLVREIERTGRVSLPTFYARRAKRLLPATAAVLVATAIGTWLIVPVTAWRAFGGDIVAAAAYVVNWRFAERSVDYLAEGTGASPVQHFWSLAVEEQFYVVWPLLLVAVAWWVRHRRGAQVRPVMAVALLLIVLPSFWWSVHLSQANPAQAFFVTTTRLWELGLGAFVAIGAPLWSRVPRAVAIVLGWGGLLGVLASAFVYSGETVWPGSAALLPTLGTAAVIVAGWSAGRTGPTLLLGLRPMVWVGAMSYSLYLWHWPAVILATAYWGELGQKRGLAVVIASIVPAWLSLKLIENPIRFAPSLSRSPRLALSLGANMTLVGVVAGLVLMLAVPEPERATVPTDADASETGAALVTKDPEGAADLWQTKTVEWMIPLPTEAEDDVPEAYDDGCQASEDRDGVVTCEYGDPRGERTIALVGDSKALQWQSALDTIGEDQGWQVLTFTRSACPVSASPVIRDGAPYETCEEWNAVLADAIVDAGVDVVVTSQRANSAMTSADGVAEQWQSLVDAGVGVVALLDNPAPAGGGDYESIYECVAENEDDLSVCSFERAPAEKRSGSTLMLAAAEQVPQVQVIDMNDIVCPGERCPAVIGNVLVYRQGSHLTRTYVDTAAPALSERLVPAVEEALG